MLNGIAKGILEAIERELINLSPHIQHFVLDQIYTIADIIMDLISGKKERLKKIEQKNDEVDKKS